MAEGMPSVEYTTLDDLLAGARFRQGLPEDTDVLAADSLIAGTPRGVLAIAITHALGANRVEEANLSQAHLRLADAAQHLRTATGAPSRESIDPSAKGRAPDVLSLYEMFSGSAYERSDYITLGDPDLLDAAATFDTAGTVYDTALSRKKDAQKEADLANQIKARRRRLSLLPQVLIVALSTAVLGGGSYVVDHDIQANAQRQLATMHGVPHSNPRYTALQEQASPRQAELLDAVCLAAGIGGGAIAALSAQNSIARRRSTAIVLRASQAISSAGPPDELPEATE